MHVLLYIQIVREVFHCLCVSTPLKWIKIKFFPFSDPVCAWIGYWTSHYNLLNSKNDVKILFSPKDRESQEPLKNDCLPCSTDFTSSMCLSRSVCRDTSKSLTLCLVYPQVSLSVPGLPVLEKGEAYSCFFQDSHSPAVVTEDGVSCHSPDTSRVPMVPPGQGECI